MSQALVVLTAWLSIAPALHGADHDRNCEPELLFHDETQHVLSAGASSADVHTGEHCLACHLFRSSRYVGGWKFIPQALDGRHVPLPFTGAATSARQDVPLPARAPPALA